MNKKLNYEPSRRFEIKFHDSNISKTFALHNFMALPLWHIEFISYLIETLDRIISYNWEKDASVQFLKIDNFDGNFEKYSRFYVFSKYPTCKNT